MTTIRTSVFPCKRPKELEDWQSSVPAETVERAKKALKDNVSSFVGTANFIGVGATDDHIELQLARGCHANMPFIDASCRDVLATENGRFRRQDTRGKVSAEEARPFLSWFLYDSPYGFIILSRDDFEFCEEYGFVLAGDAPTTLVQSACIISRHFYECYSASFLEFNKLVERGIDGMIAYQICFNSTISNLARNSDLSKSIFDAYGGHRVSDAVVPSQLINYYTGEIQNPLKGTYKKKPGIYGSTHLFLKDYYYRSDKCLCEFRKHSPEFQNLLLEHEGKLTTKSDVYRPPNPFVKKRPDKNEFKFTCEQAVTVVADYLQQQIKEKLSNV